MPWFRQDSNFRSSGCRGVGFRAVQGLGVEGLRVKPTPSDSHLDSCTLQRRSCFGRLLLFGSKNLVSIVAVNL